jgi:AraC-like DNA-binding protein
MGQPSSANYTSFAENDDLRVDGFDTFRRAGFQTALHDHPRGELIWSSVVQEVRSIEQVWVAAASAAIWLPPGAMHRSVTPYTSTEHTLYFDAPLCAGLPSEPCVVRLSAALRMAAEATIRESARASRDGSDRDDLLIATLLEEIRPSTTRSLRNPVRDAATTMRPIVEAVERAPNDPRAAADWARLLGMTGAQLRRRFQGELGRSFRQWRGDMRMLAALELLARGERVIDVAAQVGFRSVSSFVTAFHRDIGVTPRDFFAPLAPQDPNRRRNNRTPDMSGEATSRPGASDAFTIEADVTRVAEGCYFPRHAHDGGELLWSPSGVLSVGTSEGVRLAKPGQAVWIPAGHEHDAQTRGVTTLYYMQAHPGIASLPERCCVVQATPALVRAFIALARHAREVSAQQGDATALLDQLRASPRAPLPLALPLPLPLSPQGPLEPVIAALRADPSSEHRLEDWAAYLSLSPSTLARTFRRDTGHSLGDWRRMLRLRFAVERLALGDSVVSTAKLAGYDSPSMFVAMFRRVLGTTPARYCETL